MIDRLAQAVDAVLAAVPGTPLVSGKPNALLDAQHRRITAASPPTPAAG